VNVLLDTNALLWWLAGENLRTEALTAVQAAENLVVVSAASIWEMAIKRSLGRLSTPDDVAEVIAASGFEPLDISFEHAETAGSLPPHHSDPFDRMLVAQALVEGLTVVTRDAAFDAYDIDVLHC
jgi:PIN domain nuclease of toxin-antitoxin system